MENDKKRLIIQRLLLVLAAALTALYTSVYHYQLLMIQGSSMEPALSPYQIVVIDKHIRDYSRGDMIAFRNDSVNILLVKRIAACPGDAAVIKDGILYVNNEPVLLNERIEYTGLLGECITLKENEYLMLGDNINKSIDSRDARIGIISSEDIIGKIL